MRNLSFCMFLYVFLTDIRLNLVLEMIVRDIRRKYSQHAKRRIYFRIPSEREYKIRDMF